MIQIHSSITSSDTNMIAIRVSKCPCLDHRRRRYVMVLSSFHVVVERRRCLSVLNITEPGEVLMGLNSSVPAEASTVELISFLKTAIKEGDIENFHQLCLQLADAFSSAAADAAANGQSDRAWVYDAGSLLHFIVDVISIAPVRGDQEECIQMKMLSSVLQHEPIRFALEYSQNLETPLQHAARLGLTTACRALIERGASVESSMQDGNTALSVAAAYDHIDTMSLLLWSGSHYRLKIQARPKPFIPSFQNQIGSRPASRPSSPGRRYSGNSGNSVSRQSVESSSRSHSVLRTAPLLSPEVTSLLHSSTTPAESAENVQVVAFFLHPSQLVGFGDSDTESDDDTSVVSAKSTAPPEMPQSSADLSTTSIFTDDLEQTIRLANERARGSVTTQDNVSSSLAGEINLSLWQVAGPRAKEFLSKFALSRLSEFDSTSPSNRQSGSNSTVPSTPSLEPRWTPDDASSSCLRCGAHFTLLFRKHHCRRCGKLLCDDCTPTRRHINSFGATSAPVRVCVDCARLVDEENELFQVKDLDSGRVFSVYDISKDP